MERSLQQMVELYLRGDSRLLIYVVIGDNGDKQAQNTNPIEVPIQNPIIKLKLKSL